MFLEEGGAEGCIAEGLGSSWAEGRQGTGDVAEGGGAEWVVTAEPGVEEARVETVAGADGIDGIDEEGGDPFTLNAGRCALLDERAAGTAFDDDERDTGGKGIESLVESGLVGYPFEFVFVRKEEVYFVEEGGEDAGPMAGGVIVGIEREGEAGVAEVVEELWQASVEVGLQE